MKAKDDEVVVFGWMEYPSRQARDAAGEKMRSDPRMKEMGETMPFDGKRMIFGGFESIVDEANGDRGGYLDGYLVPVPEGKKEAYRELAQKAAQVFKEVDADDALDDPDVDAAFVENGALLDVQLDERGQLARFAARLSEAAGIAADLAYAFKAQAKECS